MLIGITVIYVLIGCLASACKLLSTITKIIALYTIQLFICKIVILNDYFFVIAL